MLIKIIIVADEKMMKITFEEVQMKRLLVLLVTLILISLPAFSTEVLEKEFRVKEGQKLDVNLKSGGSIQIIGWNKKVVYVKVYFKNDSTDECNLELKQSGDVIKIESDFNAFQSGKCRSPELEIQVPRRFDLKLKSMGGSISIENVEGDIKGRTMGGNLNLSRLKGEIRMTTMGGKIILTDSDIDGYVKTMGGRVLLENVVGDIKGSSMGGNVVYRNVKSRKGKSTGKVVKITTMGGSINVDKAVEGADVYTMGGDINIKYAGMFAKAKTMGGDISIDQIDGWVKATTMGGDIEVVMTGDPKKGKRDVELSSMGGDISLTVPENLSMNIDIELVYTKRNWKKYKITSDFKINIEESNTWEKRNGSYRKYIYGKANIKGGKHRIKIKTINGNIYLKKTK